MADTQRSVTGGADGIRGIRPAGDSLDGAALFAETSFDSGVLAVRFVSQHIGEREVGVLTKLLNDAVEQAGKELRSLILDLSAVSMLSSLALGLCIDLRNQAEKRGAKTYLSHVQPQLRDLLNIVKAQRLFTIVKSERELRRAYAA